MGLSGSFEPWGPPMRCCQKVPTFAPAGMVITSLETGLWRPVLQVMSALRTSCTGLLEPGERTPKSRPCEAPLTDTSWKMVCAETDVAARAARAAENFMIAIYCRYREAVQGGENRE